MLQIKPENGPEIVMISDVFRVEWEQIRLTDDTFLLTQDTSLDHDGMTREQGE
jgi:hypothetical protein